MSAVLQKFTNAIFLLFLIPIIFERKEINISIPPVHNNYNHTMHSIVWRWMSHTRFEV